MFESVQVRGILFLRLPRAVQLSFGDSTPLQRLTTSQTVDFGNSVNLVTAGAHLQQGYGLPRVASPLTHSSCSFQLGSGDGELMGVGARAEAIFRPQLRIATELGHFEHLVRIYR